MKPPITLFCALLLCGCETVPVLPTPQPQHKPVTRTIKLIPVDNQLIDGFVGPVNLIPPLPSSFPQFTQFATSFTRTVVHSSPPATTNIAITVMPDGITNNVMTNINQRVQMRVSGALPTFDENEVVGAWGTNVLNRPNGADAEFYDVGAVAITFRTQAGLEYWQATGLEPPPGL